MKTALLFVALGLAGLSSCTTKCPAYSSTEPATQVASPITASTAQPTEERQ